MQYRGDLFSGIVPMPKPRIRLNPYRYTGRPDQHTVKSARRWVCGHFNAIVHLGHGHTPSEAFQDWMKFHK